MKSIKLDKMKISITALVCSMVFILSGCGGSSSSNNDITPTPTPDSKDLSILISSPSQYPTGISSSMPIMISNYGESEYNSLNYTINQNTTGSDLVINQTSLDNCKSIPAGSSCILDVQVPANANAGAFNLVAQNANNHISVQVNKTTANQVTGLTDLPPSNGLSGIDGVTFYYSKRVTLPTNKTSVMLFTMVVTSTNAGNFNTLDLVDSDGNSLPYEVLTGNSGNNMSPLAKNSIVTLAVTIPSGATQLTFYPSLKLNGNEINNGKLDNPINIPVLHTDNIKQANVMMVPSNFALNSSVPTQRVTLFNSGSAEALALNIAVNEPVIIDWANSTCTSNGSLSANTSCTYSVTFPDVATSKKAGSGALVLNYSDGVEQTTTNSNYTYRGAASVAGLMISSTSNPRFYFSTSTAKPIESAIVTLTNMGTVDLMGLEYELPNSSLFSVVNDSSIPNQCGTNIVLPVNASCNLALVYNNDKATLNTNGTFRVGFGYVDPVTAEAKNGSSEVGVSYNTIQSQAILNVDKPIVDFGNIVNNNTATSKQTITITNIGEIATNGAITLSGLSKYYNVVNNTCINAIAAGSSCTVELQAGPIDALIPAGELEDEIGINYIAYPEAGISKLVVGVVTQVVTAGSAIFDVTLDQTSGFAGGLGTQSNPYQIESATTGTISYTIINSGTVANDFMITGTDSILPWKVQSNTCNGTIAANTSCTITFVGDNLVTGAANLKLNNLQMVWADEAHPLVDTQDFAQTAVYVNVVPKALITFDPINIHLLGGESQLVTATLSGGYNVSNQDISFIDSSGAFVITPNSCTLNKNTSVCTFEVYAVPLLIDGNYTLNVTNSGNVALSTSTINVKVSISDTWAWMGGAQGSNNNGVYGQKGIPNISNTPGGREEAVTWVDENGDFWLFGGNGFDAFESMPHYLNDLWKFNTTTNQWMWIAGSNQVDQSGNYGVKGQESIENIPGARDSSISWIDHDGNLWLFGGVGYANNKRGSLNDLWRFNTTTNQWTWISGESIVNSHAVYGTKGVANANNIPGARNNVVSWTDVSGNLWLFGGRGYTAKDAGTLNDLWKYNPITNQWTWVSGSDQVNQIGTYGTKGIASVNNIPTSRNGGVSFIDKNGKFWLFGGSNGITGEYSYLNDLWMYDPTSNQWMWVSGSNQGNGYGVYGEKNIPSINNTPGGRYNPVSWVDNAGNFWLMSGYGYTTVEYSTSRLSDLWRYNPTTKQWTWMNGAKSSVNLYGQYGNLYQSGVNNYPGSRSSANSWVDASGHLWLFGGYGSPASSSSGYLNDLWKYTPPGNQ